jgi:hypothetical protein
VTVIRAAHESGRARVEDGRLLVGDDDRTTLVNDVLRQVEVIRLGLAAHPNRPVTGRATDLDAMRAAAAHIAARLRDEVREGATVTAAG